VVISTGGLGPGKYDLVKDAFSKAGGRVVMTTMGMRPGKSLLFGVLGKTLYFGLPGPPAAVQTLLHVLIAPILLALQGVKEQLPQKSQAYLRHDIELKRDDVLRLKDGILSFERGICAVRLAERFELSNCYILLQSGQPGYLEGQLIDVYLTPVYPSEYITKK